MRKVDRLFEVIQLLRGRRLRTAEFIANKLGISVRTVYRDIQGLISSGVPIEGERGIGYIIRQPIEIPPLNFTPLELRAIMLGIDMVKAIADQGVSVAAQEAAIKIQDAMPAGMQRKRHLPIAHIYFESDAKIRNILEQLRAALDEKRKVKINYTDESGEKSARTVRPLGIEYWGKVWTITAWCEFREDFRMFRIDRIGRCEILPDHFKDEVGKTYRDYISRYASNGQLIT